MIPRRSTSYSLKLGHQEQGKTSPSFVVGPVVMETVVLRTEQLSRLLVASRSGLVQSWDPTMLMRVLSWGCFFQQLHSQLQAQPSLCDTLKHHLRQKGLVSLDQLRRCPELLGLALLENQALPSTTRYLLYGGLFFPAAGQEDSFVNLLARRRAASQLLLHHLGSPLRQTASAEQQEILPVRTQAQLLLLQSQGQGENDRDQNQASWALMDHLHYGPMFYRVVAAALLEPGWEVEAKVLLLPWLLLGDPAHLSSFCRLLPAPSLALLCICYPELLDPYLSILSTWGSCLSYNPVNGEWQTSGLRKGEVSWQELQERALCLYQKPEPLGSAVQSQIKQLKARDGDFEVRGLSVWTDLLLDMETLACESKPGRLISSSAVKTKPKHLKM